MSRTEYIEKLRKDFERIQERADQEKLVIYGQIKAFEALTADSVRVKK